MTIEPGIYEHFKGQRYEVFGTARHSETEEVFVSYRKLYDDYSYWVRPIEMFIERSNAMDTQVRDSVAWSDSAPSGVPQRRRISRTKIQISHSPPVISVRITSKRKLNSPYFLFFAMPRA